MASMPPRRIGESTPHPLHAPPQRHHPDPAAPKSMIRPLPAPGAMAETANVPQAVSSDHAQAVQAEIAQQAKQVNAGGHPTSGSPTAGGITL